MTIRTALLSLILLPSTTHAQEKSPGKEEAILQKLEALQKSLDAIQESYKKDLDDLGRRLQNVERRLSALEAKPPPPTPPNAYGTVRLVNDYAIPVTVYVNGLDHHLPPGVAKDITTPAGTLRYSVPAATTGECLRHLKPGETFTIRVYTLPAACW